MHAANYLGSNLVGIRMSRPAALIVDDQPIFGLVVSDILQESGFDAFHAFDADDATALLNDHPEIELIVTEAELHGGINGLELARRVSQTHPDLQLIVTSAENLEPAALPKTARVLRKPFASGELRTVVAAKLLELA